MNLLNIIYVKTIFLKETMRITQSNLLHFWVLLAQRRRSSNDVQTSGNVSSANRENLEPNRASASLPESSFQTPARNVNVHQQPSHYTLGSCTGINSKSSSLI